MVRVSLSGFPEDRRTHDQAEGIVEIDVVNGELRGERDVRVPEFERGHRPIPIHIPLANITVLYG